MNPELPRPKKSLALMIFVFMAAAVSIWLQDISFNEMDEVVRRKLGQFGILLVYAAALTSVFSADLSSRYRAARQSADARMSSNAARIALLAELNKDLPGKGFDRQLVDARDEEIALREESRILGEEPAMRRIANYGAAVFLVVGTLCQLMALG